MTGDAGNHLARAEALIDLKRHAAAIPLLHQAAALDPSTGRVHCLLAQAYLAVGQPRDAIAAAERGASLAPTSAWAHRLRALALLQLRRTKEATAAAEEAVRLTPWDANAFLVLTEARLARNDITGARTAAGQAMKVGPNTTAAHQAQARWALRAHRPSEAEAALRRSLAINPDDAIAMNNLGVAQLRQLRIGKALRTYSAALLLDPTHGVAQKNIRSLIRFALLMLGFFAFLALPNTPGWLRGLADLGRTGWLAVAVAAVALVAVMVRFGPAWCRRVPGPVAATARDLLSLGRLRRPGPLTVAAVWRAWIRLAAAAFFALGGFGMVLEPDQSGDRAGGLVIATVCLLIGGSTARRLLRHHRA